MRHPKSGREAMMLLDIEGQRIERRDQAVAIDVGREMTERYFDPARIEDMHDAREQVLRAAEHAAYEAIQRERALHAEDMAVLRAWAETKMADIVTRPAQGIVTEGEDPSGASVSEAN